MNALDAFKLKVPGPVNPICRKLAVPDEVKLKLPVPAKPKPLVPNTCIEPAACVVWRMPLLVND